MTHLAGTNAELSTPFGYWVPPSPAPPHDNPEDFLNALGAIRTAFAVVSTKHGFAIARDGQIMIGVPENTRPASALPIAAYLPPCAPAHLGDPEFLNDHALKYPYMTGAMANGIGSVEIVEAMSRAGMLGSFGAAGLSIERITQAIDRLKADLGDAPFCINLIHSPNEPAHEMGTAELLIKKGVTLVE